MMNQVFISYRHESDEHARSVKRLGNLLRQANIPVALDQFYLDENPGGPNSGGWPKWCEDCANQSTCVLIIASEGWFAAYDKTAPAGQGLGAASEADLFRQALWDEQGNNARIRLVSLNKIENTAIPPRLRSWHHFRPFETGDELIQLARWIGQCLGIQNVELPTVRWPDPVPFIPDFANRNHHEWPAVVDLLSGKSQNRILLIEGTSGMGKSTLVQQTVEYARRLFLPIARVDFKGGSLNLPEALGHLDLDLSEHLVTFSRDGGTKTHLLRRDLRKLRQPILIILDSYEDTTRNQAVVDWLNLQLLAEIETALGLAIIVAGQKVPDFRSTVWGRFARHLPLSPITDLEPWREWVSRRYPGFHDKGDLSTILKLAGGLPSLMATFCQTIAKR